MSRPRWLGGELVIHINPAVAGKESPSIRALLAVGTTPQERGKSPAPPLTTRRWEQPRVCGESHSGRPSAPVRCGSTPHERGKVDRRGDSQSQARNNPAHAGKVSDTSEVAGNAGSNPAYAGKRCYVPDSNKTAKEQPRVCGETWDPLSTSGSTPQERGKVS